MQYVVTNSKGANAICCHKFKRCKCNMLSQILKVQMQYIVTNSKGANAICCHRFERCKCNILSQILKVKMKLSHKAQNRRKVEISQWFKF